MIQLQDIRYTIAQRTLFEDLNWVIGPGSRCALVGPNGTGKTTLIKVALGELRPDTGARVLARGSRIGYLPQEAAERFDGTVLDRALEAHREVRAMREELDALHLALAGIGPEDPKLAALLERSGELQHHLDLHDEHAIEPEARRVLEGLGFARPDQDRPLSEFSGGWRMRAALAALLLTDPTILFLDEPTNHLDLPAMEWLEDYLEDFHGGLVVVSHDRVFLDRVATEVRELEHARLNDYPMTFTRYLEEKEVRREQMEAQNAQLDQKIAQLSRFVERFGAKNTEGLTGPEQAQADRAAQVGARGDSAAGQRHSIPVSRPAAFRPLAGPAQGSLLRLRRARRVHRGPRRDRARRQDGDRGGEWRGQDHAAARARQPARAAHRRARGLPAHARRLLRTACRRDARPRPHRSRGARGDRHPRLASPVAQPAGQLPVQRRRRLQALPRALRRRAPARGTRPHPARPGQPAAAGRAHAPPGPRRQGGPGGCARPVPGRRGRGHARPLAHGPPGHPGAGGERGPRGALPGRLRRLRIDAPEPGRRRAGPPRRWPPPAPRPPRAPAAAALPAGARAGGKRERSERQRREREQARIEKDIEAREARRVVLEQQLADPEVYHDGARAKELVGEYERLRAELESLWQRIGEL